MSKQDLLVVHIKSVTHQHQLLGLAKPKHPLISLLQFEDYPKTEIEQRTRLISDLYQITLKKDCPCKMQYGQTSYGFINYAINEALILSDDEQKSIESIITQFEKEMNLPIDRFSQDVIISNIDLLLTYANRYYNRQFITRKPNNSELLSKFEDLLNGHFQGKTTEKELPTVTFLASQLNISPKYLSDCLKQLTGQTAQQIIHDKLIEKAKDALVTSEFSVSEIAYQLGFEYPQSFSKLFKSKTDLSPTEFRESFN